MSGKSSSSNDHFNQSSSTIVSYSSCFMTRPGSVMYAMFWFSNIVMILPLCIFILYIALQRWQKKPCSPSTAVNHSDHFTYHMVIIELVGILGSTLCFCGIFAEDEKIIKVGGDMFSFTWFGQILFHILTCMERYLAVVHPITYRSLKNERGVRIRNVIIGCAWLLCFMGMNFVIINIYIILDFFLLILSFSLISYFSIAVLCVLIRPGPGRHGGGREGLDHSKNKAFVTIIAILGVLLLRFGCGVVWAFLFVLEGQNNCLLLSCNVCINFPASLVIPLLFLQRAGKLVCCENRYHE